MRSKSGSPEMSTGVDEVILPLPGPRATIAWTTSFRSTWIVSSLEGLRNAGYFERYSARLRDGHRDVILSCVAGAWLPIEVARAHYEACEAIRLSDEEQTAMSQADENRVRRAWHSNLIASAERAKGYPWAVLSQLHRLWVRGADGGAVAVHRLGPTEARVEYVHCELFDIPYFRQAVRSVLHELVMHLSTDARDAVVDRVPGAAKGECSYALRWK